MKDLLHNRFELIWARTLVGVKLFQNTRNSIM